MSEGNYEEAAALRSIIAGAADVPLIQHTIGRTLQLYRQKGYHHADVGSPEWRQLARVIAMAELEALQRRAERDQGDWSGEPPQWLQQAPTAPDEAPVSITGLFAAYIDEQRRHGRGDASAKRSTPVFRSLVDFLAHDDATRLRRADMLRWKDQLQETLAPKTIHDVHLAAVRVVLQHRTSPPASRSAFPRRSSPASVV